MHVYFILGIFSAKEVEYSAGMGDMWHGLGVFLGEKQSVKVCLLYDTILHKQLRLCIPERAV